MDTKIEKLNLSLTEHDSITISKIKKQMLEDELSTLPPIKENDINISTSYIFDANDKIEVGVFFRNGLNVPINFDMVPLTLLDQNNNIVSTQIFNLKDLGDIPPHSARPYELFFSKSDLSDVKILNKEWKIVFKDNIKAMKTVKIEYDDFPNMDIQAKTFLENYLNTLQPLEKGNLDIKVYSVELLDDKNIKVTILIRNGNNQQATLEQIPLTIYDNNKAIIYSAVLKVSDVHVNAYKAKLINFIVDCKSNDLSSFDLSNLTVDFKTIK